MFYVRQRNANFKLSLYLVTHHAMKVCNGVEV